MRNLGSDARQPRQARHLPRNLTTVPQPNLVGARHHVLRLGSPVVAPRHRGFNRFGLGCDHGIHRAANKTRRQSNCPYVS